MGSSAEKINVKTNSTIILTFGYFNESLPMKNF